MSVNKIAALAGVSIATVSRVLNNSRRVNPHTAELVHRALEELKLKPQTSRRRRRSKSSASAGTIAIVSLGKEYRGWFEVPVIAGVVAELSRAAQEMGTGVFMSEMLDPNELNPVLKRVDVSGALVFIDSGLTSEDSTVLREKMPVVHVLGGQTSPLHIDHVGADNAAVGHLACTHLLSRNVTELAFVTTQPTWDFIRLRAHGFIKAANEKQIAPKLYLASSQPFTFGGHGAEYVSETSLEGAIASLCTHRKARMGIFFSRDEETVHAYRILREHGVEPGRDVEIISCDNEHLRLSTLFPRPVSIDLNAAEIAAHAIRRLNDRIREPDAPPIRTLIMPRILPEDAVT